MKTATFTRYILEFKQAAGTSRGVLETKETYILKITENGKTGTGECPLFRGLSYDDVPNYKEKLKWLCDNINKDKAFLRQELLHFPSIWFGYEQAILNLKNGDDIFFPSDFTEGKKSIKINGLIWMGKPDFMQKQIEEKLSLGFDCIKLKIGVNWPSEHEILKNLRKKFPAETLELRVDANGAFTFGGAKTVLEQLAALKIHSIEQPIKAGQSEAMAKLCETTPTPIALDEELIGCTAIKEKHRLIAEIKPQYIILKPALVGGFSGTDEWISIAEENNAGWWITSALESNIGLSAIAQYTFTKNPKTPQGLGTGALFTNNFPTKLSLKGDQLSFLNTENPQH